MSDKKLKKDLSEAQVRVAIVSAIHDINTDAKAKKVGDDKKKPDSDNNKFPVQNAPPYSAPRGFRWVFNDVNGKWQLVPIGRPTPNPLPGTELPPKPRYPKGK